MKKLVLMLLVGLLFVLVGCNNNSKSNTSDISSGVESNFSPESSTVESSETSSQTSSAESTVSSETANVSNNVTPQAPSTNNSNAETSSNVQVNSESTEKPPQDNSYTFEHISLTLPDGFVVDNSGNVPVAKPSNYPERTDNIAFSKSGADSIDGYTQQVLDEYYGSIFAGFIKSTEFTKMKINGVDVLKYSYEMNVSEVFTKGTQYMVFGSTYSNIVTFTSVSGDFDAAFQKSAESIKIS